MTHGREVRRTAGLPTAWPTVIETALDFASRHNVAPQNEQSSMSKAFARLGLGKARYRIVLDANV